MISTIYIGYIGYINKSDGMGITKKTLLRITAIAAIALMVACGGRGGRINVGGGNGSGGADSVGCVACDSDSDDSDDNDDCDDNADCGDSDVGSCDGVADSITIGSFTDPRDNQKYRTVKIGNLTWMAENLNYKGGTSWCAGDSDAYCEKYGRLYTWETAMIICPSGWRLSERSDWKRLVSAARGQNIAGRTLKSETGWSGGKSGGDDLGFSALPGGCYCESEWDGGFNVGVGGYWWEETEDGYDDAYHWRIGNDRDSIEVGSIDKAIGFSVRCVLGVPARTSTYEVPPAPPPIRKSAAGTLLSLTDPRDGQTYRTVTIGGNTWMAENLNYKTDLSWCYGNDSSYCEAYGRLYDWNTAMEVCPSGWHLPTNVEWDRLVAAAGGKNAGKRLKSETGWSDNIYKGESVRGTDAFGFSALPAGYRNDSGYSFANESHVGYWWSAEELSVRHALRRTMSADDNRVDPYPYYKSGGYSVRCVKD